MSYKRALLQVAKKKRPASLHHEAANGTAWMGERADAEKYLYP